MTNSKSSIRSVEQEIEEILLDLSVGDGFSPFQRSIIKNKVLRFNPRLPEAKAALLSVFERYVKERS